MEHIYIVSCQRGQRARGISLITGSYEDAIIEFHEKNNTLWFGRNKSDDETNFNYELHRVPINVKLDEEKLGLNSKFRIKFKTWKEVKDVYQVCNRESKISNLLNK